MAKQRLIVLAVVTATAAFTASAVAATGGDILGDRDVDAVDYCPTKEQLEEHWAETGRELKPRVDCNDEGAPTEQASKAPEQAGGPPEGGPASLAEAQRRYDPRNDPFKLVGQKPDGTFYTLQVATAGTPPPWVETPQDFAQWVKETASDGPAQ